MACPDPWATSLTLANEADVSHWVASGEERPHLRAILADQESPKPSVLKKSYVPAGSRPAKRPASRLQPDRSQDALTVQRSRICDRWWFVGYLSPGRTMGSEVPYGAKPFPADSETAPPPRLQKFTL